MSFGLSNVPISFQGYINQILAKKYNVFKIIYLDNIFIYIKNLEQVHINTVYQTPNILRKNGLLFNLIKCHFYKNNIYFLGYIVLVLKVKIEDKKIEVVKNWPKLKSIQDI